MFTKNKRRIIEFCLGIFILGTVIFAYAPGAAPVFELTCISNSLCGITLCLDAIAPKCVPWTWWHMLTTCISTVLCTVCFELSGYHFFNFSGAFLFLHAINPACMICMYMQKSTQTKSKLWLVPTPVMLYALFDVIRFAITGKLVYGLVTPELLTILNAILIGCGLYAFELLIAWVLQTLRSTIHK